MNPGQPRIAILGAGRAGCSLFHSLSLGGQPPALLWTRSEATAAAARAEGFPAVSGALPSLSDAEVIFLAVSDPAVPSLAQEIAASRPPARSATVAHVAGALDLEPLSSIARLGVGIGSFHPIVSIASRRLSLVGVTVGIDSSSPSADAALAATAISLGAKVIRPRGDRARYHAAAALAGNFPQVLLEAAMRLLVDCGLTRDEAREAFGPLLVSASRNAASLGPAAGLTGPVARGDPEIVRRHLEAIGDSAEVTALYRNATTIAIDLAQARGVDVAALRAVLAAN